MPTAKPQAVDPGIQAIWDAMNAYMGTTYMTCNATVTFDGAGERDTINCTAANNDNWQYVTYQNGGKVAVSPTTASLGPGQTQQFSATAQNQDGSAVPSHAFTWTVTGGGTIDATGLFTAPASIPTAVTAIVKCALNGSNSWSTVTVNLHP